MEKQLACLLTLNTHFPVYVISGVMILAFIHNAGIEILSVWQVT